MAETMIKAKRHDPKYTPESFVEGGCQFHPDEIDNLCNAPLNLSDPVFLILNDLKGKLIYLRSQALPGNAYLKALPYAPKLTKIQYFLWEEADIKLLRAVKHIS